MARDFGREDLDSFLPKSFPSQWPYEFSANPQGHRAYRDTPVWDDFLGRETWHRGRHVYPIQKSDRDFFTGRRQEFVDYHENRPTTGWIDPDDLIGDNLDGVSNGYGEPSFGHGGHGYFPVNGRFKLGTRPWPVLMPNRYEDIDRPRQQAMDRVAPFIRDRQRYRKFVERQLRPDGSLVRALHKSHGKSKAVPDDIRAATLKKLRRDHRQIDSDAAWASLGAAPGPSRPPRVSLSSSSSVSASTGSVRSTAAGRAPRRPASRPRKPARPTKRRRG